MWRYIFILSLFILLMLSQILHYETHTFSLPTSYETVSEHYRQRWYKSRRWGGPTVDGPSRSLPEQCRWRNGRLECMAGPGATL